MRSCWLWLRNLTGYLLWEFLQQHPLQWMFDMLFRHLLNLVLNVSSHDFELLFLDLSESKTWIHSKLFKLTLSHGSQNHCASRSQSAPQWSRWAKFLEKIKFSNFFLLDSVWRGVSMVPKGGKCFKIRSFSVQKWTFKV